MKYKKSDFRIRECNPGDWYAVAGNCDYLLRNGKVRDWYNVVKWHGANYVNRETSFASKREVEQYLDKYLGETKMEMTVKEVEQRLGIEGLKIVKEKPKIKEVNVWAFRARKVDRNNYHLGIETHGDNYNFGKNWSSRGAFGKNDIQEIIKGLQEMIAEED